MEFTNAVGVFVRAQKSMGTILQPEIEKYNYVSKISINI